VRKASSSGSNSSKPTEAAADFERIRPLGQKLVEELELADGVDTLGKWMAHYVAQLIEEAEKAKGEDRQRAETRAFEAILQLWRHRHHYPDGRRPFESFEPLLAALHRLQSTTPHYFRPDILNDPASRKLPEDLKLWLQLIDDFDQSARFMITEALGRAAALAAEKCDEWAELVRRGDDRLTGPDLELVIELLERSDGQTKVRDETRAQLERSLSRLDRFVENAALFRDDLASRLADLADAGD
jgi:hypothetical protein